MKHRLLAMAALLALAPSCEKKEPAPTTPAVADAPAAAPAEPVAPRPAEPVVDVASLPVEEQFEADAEKEITPDNLSAKLDELEKELATP